MANDLTSVIHGIRETKGATERAEVGHFAVLPQERVLRGEPGNRVRRRVRERIPCDLAALVHKKGRRFRAAECAQILHYSLLPEE